MAWTVIILIAAAVMLGQASQQEQDSAQGAAGEASLALRVVEVQGRYIVGTASIAARAGEGGEAQLLDAAEGLNAGPPAQRLRYLAVAADIGGAQVGLEAAEDLRSLFARHDVQLSPQETQTLEAIEQTLTLRQDQGPSAAPDQATAAALRTSLGWFGELLLTPKGGADPDARVALTRPAELLVVGVIVVIAGVAALGFAGLIGAILLLVFGLTGRWRASLTTGRTRGGVYAETFAVWFVLFLGLSIGASFLPEQAQLAASGGAFLASLSALGWPMLRGLSWSDVRRDVGLHSGRGVFVEAACGVAAYAMALPLVGLGLVVMFGLMALAGVSVSGGPEEFEFGGSPTHPILEWMGAGMGTRITALILAAVIAPVVEETIFRGVLYRHLREGTRRFGAVLSAVASMLLVGLVFAAIHPQGVFAIPVLGALACGFAFAREWRDSLLPAMVAHALNNGAVVILLMVAFS